MPGRLVIGGDDGVLMLLSIACLVVLFSVYRLAWLLREHELWRERHRQAPPVRVTD